MASSRHLNDWFLRQRDMNEPSAYDLLAAFVAAF